MTQTRNRKRSELSFQERLRKFARDSHRAARHMPAGTARDELMLKARDGEAAAKIDRWLSSPELRSPK